MLPDGSLDTTFGIDNNGYVLYGFSASPGPTDGANAIALRPDGRPLLAGLAPDGPEDAAFAMMQLESVTRTLFRSGFETGDTQEWTNSVE